MIMYHESVDHQPAPIVHMLDNAGEITSSNNDIPARRITARELVDDLKFQNYKANRQYSPNISVERWAAIFGADAIDLESRYQAEASAPLPLGKHYFSCVNVGCGDCGDVKVVFIRTLKSGDQIPCEDCGERMDEIDWWAVE